METGRTASPRERSRGSKSSSPPAVASPADFEDHVSFHCDHLDASSDFDDEEPAAAFLGSSRPISPFSNMAINLRSSGSFSGLPSLAGAEFCGESVVDGAWDGCDGVDVAASGCEGDDEACDEDDDPSADLDQNQPIVTVFVFAVRVRMVGNEFAFLGVSIDCQNALCSPCSMRSHIKTSLKLSLSMPHAKTRRLVIFLRAAL